MGIDRVLYVLVLYMLVFGLFILAGLGVSWPAHSLLSWEWLVAAAVVLSLLV